MAEHSSLPKSGLATAKYIYVTTWSASGKPGTVPVWFAQIDGRPYFTTLRKSLKARRIKRSGRVQVHIGAPDGPGFDGTALVVEGRPDLERRVLSIYRRKYWLLVPLFMGPLIRRRLRNGQSVLIEITPEGVSGAIE